MSSISSLNSTNLASTATTATTTSSSSTGTSSFSALGIGSGLDLNSIIDGLMSIERQPQDQLKAQLAKHQSTISQYQTLSANFAAVHVAAQALNLGPLWKVNAATSSDASVTASADSTAIPGTFSFAVKNLATSQTLASFGSVSGMSSVVGTGQMLFGQTGAMGFSTLHGSGLATGAHTLAVTQSSAGASIKGSAVGNSVTLNGTETLQANVDGVGQSFTLTAGTYNQQQLAAMVTQASGGKLNVTVNSDTSLQVATTHEGSAAHLSITGGSGLSALGLNSGPSATGTNGIVTVDGTATTVSDVRPDGSNNIALNGPSGTITTSFNGGLRVGSAALKNIDLGDGKLSTVVNNINAAGLPISATAVQVAPNQYKLQLQSNTTGSAGAIGMDLSAFSTTLGSMQTVNAAQDAVLQVGSGAGSYSVTSSSNAVSGVLAGVTLNLTSADPTKQITVTVGGDGGGLADKVQALVTAANTALSYINSNSKFDSQSKSAGSLLGNDAASNLQQQLYSMLTDSVGGTSLAVPSSVGIKGNADGTFTFDKAAFLTAYRTNPEAVASMFVEGGTTSISTYTQPGIAERLGTMAQGATDSVSGLLTTAISGENTTISDLNTQISDWDKRLSQKQDLLKQQFAALDTAIAGYKSQQTWLAGQITALAANHA